MFLHAPLCVCRGSDIIDILYIRHCTLCVCVCRGEDIIDTLFSSLYPGVILVSRGHTHNLGTHTHKIESFFGCTAWP
jgi:hypothetical protein